MQLQLPPVHVPALPHCESAVHAAQTLPMHAWPELQSSLVLQAVVHVPIPQACPVAQSLFWVQEQ